MEIFNLNNRNGKIPNVQKTLDGLSKLLTSRSRLVRSQMTVLPVPLIIASHFSTDEVFHDAPYFKNKRANFVDAFMKADPGKKNLMFMIIANDFTENGVLNSHMLMGINFAMGKRLIFIDPNSNVTNMDNIYKGRSFLKAPKLKNLTNPLYNTLARFFKVNMRAKKIDMRFYSGEPILCPQGGATSCSYRTVMIMIGMKLGQNNVKQALEFANFMALNEFSKVKTLLNKIFNDEANTKSFFENFLRTIEKKAIQNDYISISPSSNGPSSEATSSHSSSS